MTAPEQAGTPAGLVERVARKLAASTLDRLLPGDQADDAWWGSRSPALREEYRATAAEVVGIVRGHAADWLTAQYPGPGADRHIRRAAARLRALPVQDAGAGPAAGPDQEEVTTP